MRVVAGALRQLHNVLDLLTRYPDARQRPEIGHAMASVVVAFAAVAIGYQGGESDVAASVR